MTETAAPVRRDPLRRPKILAALRSLRDVSETLQRGDSGGKFVADSRALQMPHAYSGFVYPTLVEQLLILRRVTPRHYWMLAERYLRSERLTRELVHRKGVYHEPLRVRQRIKIGEPLPVNAEVLQAVAVPKGVLATRPGEPRAVLVRAIVERWNEDVERRLVETAVDYLSAMLPARIFLPREVLAAMVTAPGSRAAA